MLFTKVLTAGIVHWMLTQGAGAPEMLNTQPAIIVTSVTTRTGAPPTSTVGLLGTVLACPPWGHMMRADALRIGAAIGGSSSRREPG